MKRRSFMALAAAPAVAPLLTSCSGDTNRMEVFSWWTDSEKPMDWPNWNVCTPKPTPMSNSSTPRPTNPLIGRKTLWRPASRSPPTRPDSFQEHAGEGLADHIDNGAVEDLSGLYTSQGWNDVMHPGLMENLTRRGGIYGVTGEHSPGQPVVVQSVDSGTSQARGPADLERARRAGREVVRPGHCHPLDRVGADAAAPA